MPVVARRPGEIDPVGGVDLGDSGEGFALGSLPPGVTWITVASPDRACAPVRLELPGGLLQDVVVPALPGTPITLRRGARAPGRVHLAVRGADGQVAWNGPLDPGQSTELRLRPGTFSPSVDPGYGRALQVGHEPLSVDL